MNKVRRKALTELAEQFEALKENLEAIMEEEEEYRDSIPENLQGSERYEKSDEACDNLSNAVDAVDEILEYLEAAQE